MSNSLILTAAAAAGAVLIGFVFSTILQSFMGYCGRRAAQSERPDEFLTAPALWWLFVAAVSAGVMITVAIGLAYGLLSTLIGGQP